MQDALMKVVNDVFVVLLPVLAGYLVVWAQKALGAAKVQKINETLQAKQTLSQMAVLFVQQAYKDLGGPAKYDYAAKWFSDAATAHGMTITDAEVKTLIESALKAIKLDAGQEWKKSPEDPAAVVADTAPAATADQTPVDTAGQAAPAQPETVDQPTASGTAAPATGPGVQTQLSQAMAKVNAAQAEYNQLVQQVAGGQQAIA